MSRRLAAAVNLMKTWALLIGASALLAGLGWLIGGYRLFSIVFFAGLLAGIAPTGTRTGRFSNRPVPRARRDRGRPALRLGRTGSQRGPTFRAPVCT